MRNNFDRWVVLVALVFYILTAYFNIGYFHPDEHYQIIEFARTIDSEVTGEFLTWEYHERIRPALQPTICWLVFKSCDLLSIHNHFDQVFVLRLLTAILAVISIYLFSKSFKRIIPDRFWKFFLLTAFFIWFIPFINVRFSSETWSGFFLMFSVIIALKENKRNYHFLILGLLAGISFLFRFQVAVASAGLFHWLFIVERSKLKYSLSYIFGLFVILAAGILLDSWYYGEFTLTPWLYFKVNILNDVASNFGEYPWFYYFYYIFRYSFFPIGILIILSFGFLIIRRPTNILVWIILPFFIIHSLIPHKELRFMFPVMNFLPAVITLVVAELYDKQRQSGRKYFHVLAIILVLINGTCLATANLKPADKGRIQMAQIINDKAKESYFKLYHTNEANPYEPFKILKTDFYQKSYLSVNEVSDYKNNIIDTTSGTDILLVVLSRDLKDPEINAFIKENNFRKISQSIPEAFIPLLKLYGGYNTDEILYLYMK